MNERPFSMLDLLLDVEPLSQVTFVHDYIQLAFQDTYFSLYNQVTIARNDNVLTRNDLGFCDELCRLIGQRVIDTHYVEGESTTISFEQGTKVSISFRPEHCNGPEAFELGDGKGLCVVEQNT